jgi:hypothetical protein
VGGSSSRINRLALTAEPTDDSQRHRAYDVAADNRLFVTATQVVTPRLRLMLVWFANLLSPNKTILTIINIQQYLEAIICLLAGLHGQVLQLVSHAIDGLM